MKPAKNGIKYDQDKAVMVRFDIASIEIYIIGAQIKVNQPAQTCKYTSIMLLSAMSNSVKSSAPIEQKSYSLAYSSPYKFITVSGIIGVGKTTLCKNLAKSMEMKPEFEPVKENPYLPLFYGDMATYSFPMQIFLLSKRFRQHQGIVWNDKAVIQDRSIYEDPIFAKMLRDGGLMTPLDFENYSELFINMTNFLHRPDLIVYLDVDPEVAMERIKSRGRECEKDITLDYLKSLRDGYEDWLKDISRRIPVLRVDWNEFRELSFVQDKIENFFKTANRHRY
jgi:deoxyadenosine kinase